jgi:anti-sigma B factor antagonist
MNQRPDGVFEIETNDGVVTVRGDIDMGSIGELANVLEQLEGTVVLELEEVTFLDSSGLQGMIDAQQLARERGDDLILRRPSSPVRRVLEMTDLNSVFVIET